MWVKSLTPNALPGMIAYLWAESFESLVTDMSHASQTTFTRIMFACGSYFKLLHVCTESPQNIPFVLKGTVADYHSRDILDISFPSRDFLRTLLNACRTV